jgi:hypothetical protein
VVVYDDDSIVEFYKNLSTTTVLIASNYQFYFITCVYDCSNEPYSTE